MTLKTTHETTTERRLIEVENLSVSYPGTGRSAALQAVSDVSFAIPAGSTLALVGESGSGKTTVGRAILGLVPAQGSVRFQGKALAMGRTRRKAVPGMQMIFQDPLGSLDPRWTAGRSISEGLTGLSGNARDERVRELLELVHLSPEHAGRKPRELSGGQRQRVAIARALATQPQFLVCDEPTSALDVSVAAAVIGLLRELQAATGVTYLFISHDLPLVRDFADHVVVMHRGRVASSGTAHQIFTGEQDEYTTTLLTAASAYSLDAIFGRDGLTATTAGGDHAQR